MSVFFRWRRLQICAVAFGQVRGGLPGLHGLFQRHAAGNGLLAAGVDGLNLFHPRTGEGVSAINRTGEAEHLSNFKGIHITLKPSLGSCSSPQACSM